MFPPRHAVGLTKAAVCRTVQCVNSSSLFLSHTSINAPLAMLSHNSPLRFPTLRIQQATTTRGKKVRRKKTIDKAHAQGCKSNSLLLLLFSFLSPSLFSFLFSLVSSHLLSVEWQFSVNLFFSVVYYGQYADDHMGRKKKKRAS